MQRSKNTSFIDLHVTAPSKPPFDSGNFQCPRVAHVPFPFYLFKTLFILVWCINESNVCNSVEGDIFATAFNTDDFTLNILPWKYVSSTTDNGSNSPWHETNGV